MEIKTQVHARDYLSKMLRSNLQIEIMSVNSAFADSKRASASSANSTLIVDAPDVFYSAAIMCQNSFYIG